MGYYFKGFPYEPYWVDLGIKISFLLSILFKINLYNFRLLILTYTTIEVF